MLFSSTEELLQILQKIGMSMLNASQYIWDFTNSMLIIGISETVRDSKAVKQGAKLSIGINIIIQKKYCTDHLIYEI